MVANDPFQNLYSNLKDEEPPMDLHSSIMGMVLHYRIQRSLRLLSLFMAATVGISFWHLLSRASANEVWSLMQLAFNDFEWSVDYVIDFGKIIFRSLPFEALLVFTANCSLGIMLYRLIKQIVRPRQQVILP